MVSRDRGIERIEHLGELLAVVVRSEFDESGIHFFTPDDFSQQLGCMTHPKGKTIAPHVHNRVDRQVRITQEVIFVRKGRLRVDFYDNDCNYLESRILAGGDVILLASGGHGFEVIEDVQMIEIKQGPYSGEADKTRFDPISAKEIRLPEDIL